MSENEVAARIFSPNGAERFSMEKIDFGAGKGYNG